MLSSLKLTRLVLHSRRDSARAPSGASRSPNAISISVGLASPIQKTVAPHVPQKCLDASSDERYALRLPNDREKGTVQSWER